MLGRRLQILFVRQRDDVDAVFFSVLQTPPYEMLREKKGVSFESASDNRRSILKYLPWLRC